MSETSLMALKSDWLNCYQTQPNTSGYVSGTLTVGATGYWPSYPPYYYPVTYASPARPIKLRLSEIELLRQLAKADDAVKAILEKFTGLIEITVDFA